MHTRPFASDSVTDHSRTGHTVASGSGNPPGSCGHGVLDAVARISGVRDVLVPFSNEGLGAAELEAALERVLDEAAARVVFTDLPAGSCTMAARRLARRRPGLVVASGANLPLLLTYVLSADPDPVTAVQGAVEKGRAGVALLP